MLLLTRVTRDSKTVHFPSFPRTFKASGLSLPVPDNLLVLFTVRVGFCRRTDDMNAGATFPTGFYHGVVAAER